MPLSRRVSPVARSVSRHVESSTNRWSRRTQPLPGSRVCLDRCRRLSAANKNKKPLGKGFTLTDAMVADFRESLKAQKVVMDEAAFTKDETFIRAMIRYDIDVALFGTAEARKNLIGKDPQAQFALAQFPDAVRLTTLSARKQ